ncbi:MAG TPA: flagellar basal body P-ring formation chaperone FlgA [Devosia sp.]|jgi:flagella basal body P-ring formation protein FlgA|nr:flagellar basal body P-ring formation chaperone FlgA [Devosia sp.]
MIPRTAIATATSLLLSSLAWAAPVLKADIIVNNPIVTVGDMFDAADTIAEQPLFRAPEPGTSGLVGIAEVDAALARIGIEEFESAGLASVRVTRAAFVVDEAVLTDVIAADLTARGIIGADMTVDTLFSSPVQPINAEAVAEPVSVVSLRYLPGSSAFTARFAIAGVARTLDVSGSIELMIDAPHITASLPAGTLLSNDDIEMRPVPLRFVESTGVARLQDVIGKTLVRQSRGGMMLKASDVSVPLLVSKNDPVTIYFRNGPMTLTVKGQAVTGAAKGGLVQVINLMSKRVISAVAISAGAVEVSAAPLAVADL